MKTLNKIYISLFLLASLTSCSSYLDTYPHTSASPDGVSVSDLTAMRNGMYNRVQNAPGQYSYIAFDLFGGDFLYSQAVEPINYINNQLTALSGIVSGQWDGYYKALIPQSGLLKKIASP